MKQNPLNMMPNNDVILLSIFIYAAPPHCKRKK